MNQIQLHNVLPDFLSDTGAPVSEIWLRDICFRKGEAHLLSAASGTGKSSLLSYLFGERSDYRGAILYNNDDITRLKPAQWSLFRQHQISFVFQGLRLFSELTALENIRLKNRLTQHKSEGEIRQLLKSAGLSGKCDEQCARLSFGQQQRVAIIRALCQPFDFLLLDEPFSHLDEENVLILSEIIRHEVQQKQAGLILCSLGAEYSFDYHQKWRL